MHSTVYHAAYMRGSPCSAADWWYAFRTIRRWRIHMTVSGVVVSCVQGQAEHVAVVSRPHEMVGFVTGLMADHRCQP